MEEAIIPARRVGAEEFLRELELATDWMLWINPAIEELELAVKDTDGQVSVIHGPHPLKVNSVEYNHFLVRVKRITEAKEAEGGFC
jgi:hypothetical protein